MSRTNKFLFMLMMLAIASIGSVTLLSSAAAGPLSTVESLDMIMARASASAPYPELARFSNDISAADNLDEARRLALKPTDEAIDALRNARTLMPFNEDLRLAETRLNDIRSRMEDANTPNQVANEFSGLMLAGLDDDEVAQVGGSDGCNYSTGEVIAIVIGLILGIIPGLILLVVLC